MPAAGPAPIAPPPGDPSTVVDVAFPGRGGAMLRGVAALPEGPGPHPGVVVVTDILGLTDDTRSVCARFAAAGYAAVASDPYSHGSKPLCVTRVLVDAATKPRAGTLDDLAATKAHLAGLPGVDGSKIGIIGFCMGGGFALAYAAQRGGVRAASINYGAVPKDAHDLATVCPVIGSYGRLDKVFAPQGDRLAAHLEQLAIPGEVKVYEGVGHGFLNDHGDSWLLRLPNPMHNEHDPVAAADAWERILGFFDEHVRGEVEEGGR